MKISIFNATCWGILLICLGLFLLLKHWFHIDFPVFKFIIALLIIYFGIRLIIGSHRHKHHQNSTIFAEANFAFSHANNNYSTTFGKSTLDLSSIDLSESKQLGISCIFGEFIIKIKKDTPIDYYTNTAFGETQTPSKNIEGFGNLNFQSESFKTGTPCLTLKTNVVFGSIKVIYI